VLNNTGETLREKRLKISDRLQTYFLKMSLNNIIIPLLRHLTRQGKDGIIIALHYMLSSVIGQDKSNLAL